MKRTFLFAGFIVLAMTSCLKDESGELRDQAQTEFDAYITQLKNSGVELEETNNGVFYEISKPQEGDSPEIGDLVIAEVTAKVIDGNTFFTSDLDTAEKYNIVSETFFYRPYRFFYGYGFTYGFHDALFYGGDSTEMNIYVPTDLGYDYIDYSPTIPAYSNLKYQVKIHNITSEPDTLERYILNKYLAANEIAVEDSTEYGIYFQSLETSEGDSVSVGDTVSVKYTASFLDGTVFDETTDDDTFDFIVGSQYIIYGFNAGVLEMTEGSKGRFIIPYYYGYGENPNDYLTIYFPPYSTLIFDVELVEIL